ncbi:MAG TPA: hypothetical protein DIV86_01395, partial [Alphaproteobacteria bacterium]|nr:hypothetical protein [Alphaproteobacteria bacterium]
ALPISPEKKYKLFNGKDIETLNSGFKSILFHKEYIDLLHDSLLNKPVEFQDIRNLLSSADMKKPESRPAPEVLQNVRVESPSVYLKTIMLAENGKWTIWYNSTKIRKEELKKESKIKIIEVNDRNVLFQLEVEHIDQLSPKYLEKLQLIEEGNKLLRKPNSAWNYISKDGHILFDTVQGIARFRIGVNQTFSLYDADIYEGFKESTMVDVKVKQKLDSFSGAIANEPAH